MVLQGGKGKQWGRREAEKKGSQTMTGGLLNSKQAVIVNPR